MPDETEIDRWLCAVRLVKTRPMAPQLCEGGHVRVNGNPTRPSTKVRAGDVGHARIAGRERIVEVVQPIETRVGRRSRSRATWTLGRRRRSERSARDQGDPPRLALALPTKVLWRARQDSNLRPSAPEADALSTELQAREPG